MSYTINYDQGTETIMVAVHGELDLQLLQRLATDVAAAIKRHDCKRILNDLRNARLTQKSFDIYQMPEEAKKLGIGHSHKRALVVEDRATDFHFLETVFVNRGYEVKMFTNPDEALVWLSKD